MNAYSMAQTAYAPSSAPINTHRGNEYEAIARVTRELKAANAAEEDFPALIRALHENGRLWRFLATSVADNDNALPTALRADLLSLAQFSLTHGDKVLAREEDASALIEINTAIMRGLRARDHGAAA